MRGGAAGIDHAGGVRDSCSRHAHSTSVSNELDYLLCPSRRLDSRVDEKYGAPFIEARTRVTSPTCWILLVLRQKDDEGKKKKKLCTLCRRRFHQHLYEDEENFFFFSLSPLRIPPKEKERENPLVLNI